MTSRIFATLVPLHLGDHTPGNVPTLGLVNEVVIPEYGLLRRSAYGPLQ
jgi:hypothetical protein